MSLKTAVACSMRMRNGILVSVRIYIYIGLVVIRYMLYSLSILGIDMHRGAGAAFYEI
jgi:hypothetical protein